MKKTSLPKGLNNTCCFCNSEMALDEIKEVEHQRQYHFICPTLVKYITGRPPEVLSRERVSLTRWKEVHGYPDVEEVAVWHPSAIVADTHKEIYSIYECVTN